MKEKGFTLIELLAVIVILAIISLITVPVVVNIISDSKKVTQQKSLDLYMDHVQKSISNEQMVNSAYEPDRCEIQDNGNLKCYIGDEILKTSKGQEELEIQMKGNKPKGGTITFNLTTNKTTYAGVVLEGMEYTLKDDGTVDGVIYADLARSQSGMWKDSYASYSYSVQTNLNEYVVSNEIHNANDGFGENKIIKLKKKMVKKDST